MSISAKGLKYYSFRRIIHSTEMRFQCNFMLHNNFKCLPLDIQWRHSGGCLSRDTFNAG